MLKYLYALRRNINEIWICYLPQDILNISFRQNHFSYDRNKLKNVKDWIDNISLYV